MPWCCGSFFSSRDGLLAHLRSVLHFTGTRCQGCQIRCQSLELLASHLLEARHSIPPLPRQVRLRGPPAESWFNTIRRVITTAVQYVQASDKPVARNPVNLPQQQGSRLLGFGNQRFQHPLASHLGRITNPVFPTVSAIAPLHRDPPPSAVSSSRPVPQQTTYRISSVHRDPPVHRAPLARQTLPVPQTSQRDRTAPTGTWAGLFDTAPAATGQTQRPSTVPSNVPSSRRYIYGDAVSTAPTRGQQAGIPVVRQAPARQPTAIATRSFPGQAPVPHAQRPVPAVSPVPRPSANRLQAFVSRVSSNGYTPNSRPVCPSPTCATGPATIRCVHHLTSLTPDCQSPGPGPACPAHPTTRPTGPRSPARTASPSPVPLRPLRPQIQLPPRAQLPPLRSPHAQPAPGPGRPRERNTGRPAVHVYVVPQDIHRPVRAGSAFGLECASGEQGRWEAGV